MTKRVRVLIQARMGSSRMPGKILAPLAGEPMLVHVVRRLRAAQEHAPQPLEFAVATTVEPQDDVTEHHCQLLGIRCFRGSAEDVLERYLLATADLLPNDTVVRATADNPLYCPRRTAAILQAHLTAAADYTCIANLSYVVPEAVQVGALRRMATVAGDAYSREHVTPYFRQRPGAFRVQQLPANWQALRPEVSLTVDTPEEHQRMARLFQAMGTHGRLFSLEEAYTFCSSRNGRLRVAVVGFGSIGRRHFENLADLGVTQRILVRRVNANPAFAAPPGTPVVRSDQEAIAAGIDAAVVCNPTRLHVETATRYVAAGVSVLIEKPLCDAEEQAAAHRLVVAARRSGVVVGMAYCMRYHPAYRIARETLRSGRIGRVLYAKAWFESFLPEWHPWEDYRQSYAARADLGGGALPTLDHEIDFLNWCLGEPEEVLGRTGNSAAIASKTNDHAMLILRYPDGVVASVVLSLCRRDRSRGFEFVGESASLQFRMEDARLQLVASGEPPVTLWHDPAFHFNRTYVDTLADFLTSIETRLPAPVSLDSGLAAACICSAVSGNARGLRSLHRLDEPREPTDNSLRAVSSVGRSDSSA